MRSAKPSISFDYVANADGTKKNPLVPLPSPTDFLADVERTAQKVLTHLQFQYFRRRYLQSDEEVDGEILRQYTNAQRHLYRLRIQNLTGRAFKQYGIFPLNLYLYSPSEKAGMRSCRCGDAAHRGMHKTADYWCKGGCFRNMLHHDIGYLVIGKDGFGIEIFEAHCVPCWEAHRATQGETKFALITQ